MKKFILALILFVASTPVYAWQDVVQNDPYLYKFSSGSTVQTLKTGQGILHTITPAAAGAFEIYDGPIQASALIFGFTSGSTPATIIFDVNFASGCTVVTNSGTKYTASYK